MSKLIGQKRSSSVHRMFSFTSSTRLKQTIATLIVLTSSALGSVGQAATSADVRSKPETVNSTCPAMLSPSFKHQQVEAPQSQVMLSAIENLL
jgi:hypothetical protein